MRLYIPLSAEEAERAARGEGFPEGELFFVDRPVPQEAQEDSVWVVVDVPDAEPAAYEQDVDPELGYREFALPHTAADGFVARRAEDG